MMFNYFILDTDKMSKIDFSWFNSNVGSDILQSVKQDEKLKRFGKKKKKIFFIEIIN